MRPKAVLLFAVTLCLLAAAILEAQPPRSLKGARRGASDWMLLGERTVTDRVDHDTIAVRFRAGIRNIKIKVEGQPVEFRDVKVHYGNGDIQDVSLRQVIPAGGWSRVIDLEGQNRDIKKIELWYDAQSLRGKTASVKVFGGR